jgi:hypothetical protein
VAQHAHHCSKVWTRALPAATQTCFIEHVGDDLRTLTCHTASAVKMANTLVCVVGQGTPSG